MEPSTFRAVHRYGAVLSVVAVVGAGLASAVGDPLGWLVLPLGFAGSLGGFYFAGAALVDSPRYDVLGEELLRGVVWYGASLVGWSVALTSSPVLPVTPPTVLGLPLLTALGTSLLMVAIRETTGRDLKARTDRGQLLVLLAGVVAGGLLVVYAVLVENQPPVLVLLYLVATAGGLVVWRWQRRRRRVDS